MSVVRIVGNLAAVLLFFGTLVFPFLSFTPICLLRIPEYYCNHKVDLWSFKMSDTVICFEMESVFHKSVEDHWFYDYWFYHLAYKIYRLDQSIVNEISWSLIFLFAFQTATLILAITSNFLVNKKILQLLPAILCPITTLLMVGIYAKLAQQRLIALNYQLGYWLTYPSEALFIANVIVNILKAKKCQKPH